MLLSPVQGQYTVTINDDSALGNYTVDMLIEDSPPSCEITSIVAGDDAGEYDISWNTADEEGGSLQCGCSSIMIGAIRTAS